MSHLNFTASRERKCQDLITLQGLFFKFKDFPGFSRTAGTMSPKSPDLAISCIDSNLKSAEYRIVAHEPGLPNSGDIS